MRVRVRVRVRVRGVGVGEGGGEGEDGGDGEGEGEDHTCGYKWTHVDADGGAVGARQLRTVRTHGCG